MGRNAEIEGARRFLAPYYISNLLLVVPAYLAMRWWFMQHEETAYSRVTTDGLWDKERFTLGALGFSLGIKFIKRDSLDAFFSTAAMYGKCAALLLAYFMDARMAVYYGLAAVVCYLLFPQPIYRGPSAVEPLTPSSFKDLVEDPACPATWLVQFYAPWSPPCIHLEPAVAELSLKYAGPRLRFGRVDAARWPQLAEAHKVRAYGSIPQLPTFIMFERGKELGRIPHLYEDGNVSNLKIRKQDIITAFALDEFLEGGAAKAGANNGGGKKAAGGSTKKKR